MSDNAKNENVRKIEELVEWHVSQLLELKEANPEHVDICFASLVGGSDNSDSRVLGLVASDSEFISYVTERLFRSLPELLQLSFLLRLATGSIKGLTEGAETDEKGETAERESEIIQRDPNSKLN